MQSESQGDLNHGTGGRRRSTAHPLPRILLCGETALSVEFGDDIQPSINGRVHALSQALRELGHPGILELNPTYRSLFVQYDPWELSHEQLLIYIDRALPPASGERRESPDVVEIPVCYGGELGPDLDELAAMHGLTPESVAAIHASPVYDVVMVGFTPGFPYLSGLDHRLVTPRKEVPRKVVPAGSVGIADRQTGIYSMDSPGGWQIIGRTPLRLFDLNRSDPFLVKPGDILRFTPVTRDDFESLAHS
jgi:KipI family sensor histidine kinase inhibitor